MDPHSRLIANVLLIPGFMDAVEAMLAVEKAKRLDLMRASIRDGLRDVPLIEGGIGGLEAVPALFERFAKQAIPVKE